MEEYISEPPSSTSLEELICTLSLELNTLIETNPDVNHDKLVYAISLLIQTVDDIKLENQSSNNLVNGSLNEIASLISYLGLEKDLRHKERNNLFVLQVTVEV